MGDRFIWNQKCPECGDSIEIYYAESCGFTTAKCYSCGTVFDIVQEFKLIKQKKKKP
jgi:uncharacterized Zn finger protein